MCNTQPSLTVYKSDGFPLTVQQQAKVDTSNMNAPVPTKIYGVTFEYSTFNSKYLCNSTCIQIPAQKIAKPDACEKKSSNNFFYQPCMTFSNNARRKLEQNVKRMKCNTVAFQWKDVTDAKKSIML